jgi:hypothetical protein
MGLSVDHPIALRIAARPIACAKMALLPVPGGPRKSTSHVGR